MAKYNNERKMLSKDILKDGDFHTTREALDRVAKYYPDQPIFGELDGEKNIVLRTAVQVRQDFYDIGDGLIEYGLEDKHIAIIADNSYRYVITDISIAGGVGVVTPIDKDASVDLSATLLNRCDADAIICSAHLVSKVEKILPSCPRIKTVITIDEKVDGYAVLDEIIEAGKNATEKKYTNKVLDLDKTCEILFTSGTTGANKGVELNQRNLVANILNCLDVVKGENDRTKNTSMSILPMHHATEINTHIVPRVVAGRLTYISPSMKDMMTNIKIFKPYVITVVPMVANAFYHKIWQQAKKQGKEEKLKKGIKLCRLMNKFGIDLTHKLFKDLYEPFGGNLTEIVCGGAPLNPEVVAGLKDLGMFIVNGFGITECGPLVSMNAETYEEVYSIGKACPGLTVKIDDPDENGIGELCVKGPSVSKGYYRDPEGTKQVYDDEGFFHTGDLVRMDDKQRLFIAGRKKNLIVLDNGKNVFPEEIELAVANSIPYVKDVVVYEGEYRNGDKMNRVICAGVYCEEGVTREQILADFRALNKTLPLYKNVKYVNVVDSEYEKNASRKIVRPSALKRHDASNGLII